MKNVTFNFVKHQKFLFPLFKFMSKEHAERLINHGEVYLNNLMSFTKQQYGGLVDDKYEGSIHIKNYYDKYKGMQKENTLRTQK